MSWQQWTASSVTVKRYTIAAGEWVTVQAGVIMVCDALPVFILDGVARLDGVLRTA